MRYAPLIRRTNPGIGEIPIPAIFFNPIRSPQATRSETMKGRRKRSTNPARPRDRQGRFLPTGRSQNATAPRRPRKRATNPSTYPGSPQMIAKLNPPRRPYRRGRDKSGRYLPMYNPVSYPGATGVYAQETNPRPYRHPRRKSNPNGMPPSIQGWIAPTAAAVGGFLAPGVAWYLIGDSGRAKTVGWFAQSANPEAKARFVVSAITTGILYFLTTRIDMLKKFQWQWMTGALLRTAKDGADAILSSKPGSTGLKLRMIFSLPLTSTITPSKAQLEGTSPTAPNAGLWYDSSAQSWKYGLTGQPLDAQYNETTGELSEMLSLGMVAGSAQDYGLTQIAQRAPDTDLVPHGAGITGVPRSGMGEVIPMTTDSGIGEIYVDRQIKPANTPANTRPNTPGIGEIYIDRQIKAANTPANTRPNTPGIGEIYIDRQIKAEGYKGIGALFIDSNKVYYEQGQRYPAIIGF